MLTYLQQFILKYKEIFMDLCLWSLVIHIGASKSFNINMVLLKLKNKSEQKPTVVNFPLDLSLMQNLETPTQ